MGGTAKKTGKGRLDRFYHLAKEQGYRARSAFKLIQLSKKYNFLAGANSCIDLCGAPGGWSQVAVKTMPVGSKVICVDLAPIKPIKGVVTMQCDITTPQCRTMLRREVGKNGQVDVVLNDGAPNVGANWNKDAFTQAELTLSATTLAVDMLRPGGTFVTKIFRSADYSALLWVFHQLFSKVEATKPSSSREVSAEIFVVCQNFKAPKDIDPKLLDPKFVFMYDEAAEAAKREDAKPASLNTLLKEMFARRRKRDGYVEGDEFRVLKMSDWIQAKRPADDLVAAHKVLIDVPEILNHSSTTEEIKDLCKDLKVLNMGDYNAVMKWRNRFAPDSRPEKKAKKTEDGKDASGDDSAVSSDDPDAKLDDMLSKKRREERREGKRLREKLKKSKWRQKMNEGLTGADDEPDLFSMSCLVSDNDDDSDINSTDNDDTENKTTIKSEKRLSKKLQLAEEILEGADGAVQDEAMESGDDDINQGEYEVTVDYDNESRIQRMDEQISADWERRQEAKGKPKHTLGKQKKVTRRDQVTAQWAQEMAQFATEVDKKAEQQGVRVKALAYVGDSDVSDQEDDVESDDDGFMAKPDLRNKFMQSSTTTDDISTEESPAPKTAKKAQKPKTEEAPVTRVDEIKADRFFSNPLFSKKSSDSSDDEDDNVDARNTHNKNNIKELSDSELPNLPLCDKKIRKEKNKQKKMKEAMRVEKDSKKRKRNNDDDEEDDAADNAAIEVVPSSTIAKPSDPTELAETLAYGSLLIHKKSRMQTIEAGYNRYAYQDDPEDLPHWFTSEEKMYSQPTIPLTKELAAELRAKMKEINARPIRKLAEAVGRKRHRAAQKLEKIRKQATSLSAADDMGGVTKARAISKAIAKTVRDQERKTVYTVVNKQGAASKDVSKVAAGKNAKVKVVDRRLKKDNRAAKRAAKRRK